METILLYVLVGFAAQMIDGALGMAYGVSSNTFLLSVGVPPAIASASVHVAETFTTAVSGFSHWKLGNVDKDLFKKLIIPGVLGAMLGAYLLAEVVDGNVIKPYISAYLLIMGIVILVKALRSNPNEQKVTSHISILGAIGGFFDAIGGGGWGPIVTTTLVARGNNTRFTIGSVNSSEFFITFSQSVIFIFALFSDLVANWMVIVGLLLGGIIAAPFAAIVTKKLPVRWLMGMVGLLIIGLSIRTIYQALT
ncbi:MAG TPA: sulfite exporter TauE/SafE family protein [Anaerolineales bacterium]|nr:sulfite exporter TauE/SafE family protein [Anaerolineales bacterium]